MKCQYLKVAAAAGFAVLTLGAYAQQGGTAMDMENMNMDCAKHTGDMKNMKGRDCVGKGETKATSLSDGEVKKVDVAAGRVTLKHGAIENMKMPPMTMAFPLQDKSVLSSLKEGSKVKFAVENIGGVPTITSLLPQK